VKFRPLLFMISLSSIAFVNAQQSSLKQPMFNDLKVTSSITKSFRDSTIVFHVEAISENHKPDFSRRYFWFHQGELKNTQGNFTGKLLHGTYEMFDRNGTMLGKGNFDNGLMDDDWLTWYDNGNIKARYYWKNGERIGNFREFDRQGRTTKKGKFRNGYLTGKVLYFENGVEVRKEKYRKGKLVREKEKVKNKPDSTSNQKKVRFRKKASKDTTQNVTKPETKQQPIKERNKRRAVQNIDQNNPAGSEYDQTIPAQEVQPQNTGIKQRRKKKKSESNPGN
jgi:hypothetical protein